jgi:membrane-associated phospholipid phosphatase
MKGTSVTSCSLVYRAAYTCSVMGNPLFIGAVFLCAFCLRLLDASRAIGIMAALIVLLFLPITIWIQTRVRTGRYSDFDVSRREDRTTMYPLVLVLILFATGLLFLTHQPKMLSVGMLCVSTMIVVAFLTNQWIKISLHTVFCFFFALVAIKISVAWLAPMLIFAVLVAFSRLILKRHRVVELMAGAGLGILTGCVLLLALGSSPV